MHRGTQHKPAGQGFKVYSINESHSGYTYAFMLDTKNGRKHDEFHNLPKTPWTCTHKECVAKQSGARLFFHYGHAGNRDCFTPWHDAHCPEW